MTFARPAQQTKAEIMTLFIRALSDALPQGVFISASDVMEKIRLPAEWTGSGLEEVWASIVIYSLHYFFQMNRFISEPEVEKFEGSNHVFFEATWTVCTRLSQISVCMLSYINCPIEDSLKADVVLMGHEASLEEARQHGVYVLKGHSLLAVLPISSTTWTSFQTHNKELDSKKFFRNRRWQKWSSRVLSWTKKKDWQWLTVPFGCLPKSV